VRAVSVCAATSVDAQCRFHSLQILASHVH
jgi:hypothetical protein